MSSFLRPAALIEGSLASDPFIHLLLAAFEQRFGGSLVVWCGEQPFAPNAAQQRIRFQEGIVVAAELETNDRSLISALIPLSVRRGGGYRFLPQVDVVGDARHVLRGHVDPFTFTANALRGPVRDDVIDAVVFASGGRTLQLRPGSTFERLGLTRDEWAFLQGLRRRPGSAAALMGRWQGPEHFAKRMIYLLRVTGMATVLPLGRAAESRALSIPGPPPFIVPEEAHPTAPPSADYAPARLDDNASVRSISPSFRGGNECASGTDPYQTQPMTLTADPPFAKTGALPRVRAANDTRPIRVRIPSEPPIGLTEGLAYRYRQIVRHHQRMRTRNLFELLGVGPQDDDPAIRDAHAVLVAQWRPDCLPSGLATLTPLVEEISAGLDEACETLTEPRRRYEYIERLRHGDGRLMSLAGDSVPPETRSTRASGRQVS